MRNFDFEFEEKEFLKHLYQKYGLESIVIYENEYSLSDESIWLKINNLFDPIQNDADHLKLMDIIGHLLHVSDAKRKVKVVIADGPVRAIAA